MSENMINSETKIKVSEEVRKEIFREIEDHYKTDIRKMIKGKICWRRTGLTFETMSKITLAVGGVLSFSSGYFNSNILSFVSGCVSVMSLSLLQFGSFGFKQGKKQADDLNILLKKLDLETIPVLEDDPDSLMNANEQKALEKGLHPMADGHIAISLSDFAPDNRAGNDLYNAFKKSKSKINKITVINEHEHTSNEQIPTINTLSTEVDLDDKVIEMCEK
jgi:hypothetical protein